MSYGQESCISHGFFKVAQFNGLILIYQTDSVRQEMRFVKLTAPWLELYELYYALYLCRGIGQTLFLNMYFVIIIIIINSSFLTIVLYNGAGV